MTVAGVLAGLVLGTLGLSKDNATLEAFAGNLFIGVPLLAAQFSRNRRRDEDDE